jgi:hypothetical protein
LVDNLISAGKTQGKRRELPQKLSEISQKLREMVDDSSKEHHNHSLNSLTHSLIHSSLMLLLLLALLSSPLSLCLCLVQQDSDLSLPLQDLACKTACLLADFITKRIHNVTRPTSLNLFIKKLNQSIRKISIDRLINPLTNPSKSIIINDHPLLLQLQLLQSSCLFPSSQFFYYCLLLLSTTACCLTFS